MCVVFSRSARSSAEITGRPTPQWRSTTQTQLPTRFSQKWGGLCIMSLLKFVVGNRKEDFRAYIEKRGSFTDPDRLWTKLGNLHTTVCRQFNTVFPKERRPITRDLICTLHAHVMDGLLDADAVGRLRTGFVSPANSATQYALPNDVAPRLDVLIDILENEMSRCASLRDALCIGAWFFREFLLVHPFRNGNGRVARLVLSLILEPFVYVPVSLYMPSSKAGVTPRQTYIGVLEGNSNGVPPLDAACYVCDCTLHQVRCIRDLAA